MITGTDIYNSALALLGESTEQGDITDYNNRALPLINQLLLEFPKYYHSPDGVPAKLETLDSEIYADEDAVRAAMPYGLAALLVMEEDHERSQRLMALYNDNKQWKKAHTHQVRRVI